VLFPCIWFISTRPFHYFLVPFPSHKHSYEPTTKTSTGLEIYFSMHKVLNSIPSIAKTKNQKPKQTNKKSSTNRYGEMND
jgi:hypothetical protein